MRIAVSREQIAQRAGELLAHTYVPILEQYTFSTYRGRYVFYLFFSVRQGRAATKGEFRSRITVLYHFLFLGSYFSRRL
jgi:hypothetical protein